MCSRCAHIVTALLVTGWMTLACSAQIAPALQARIEARAPALPETLAAFYKERDYTPVWTGSPEALERGEVLIGVLHTSDRDGLVPASYRTDVLAVRVRALEGGQAADAVDLELDLSEALFRYAVHLSQGRVPPAMLHEGWEGTCDGEDLPALLREALAGGDLAEALIRLRPPYAGYSALRDALARYRRLQAAGGWPTMRLEGVLARGDSTAGVQHLRSRLAITDGPLSVPAVEADRFDEALEAAVRAFQGRHGLEVDGIVGPQTLAALNVPVEEHIRQIERNLERWRWLPRPSDTRYLLINAAGGRLQVFEEGHAVLAMKVIIGKRRTPTPLFHGAIEGVVLAPYWYVPTSIARDEILPRLQRDPGYLARHHLRRLPGGQLRQDPGPGNPLGRLKFLFPNRFGVGLHDTPERHLFEQSDCAFSHGCIRLEKPIDLALYALRSDTAWTRARLEATISRWRETRILLPEPIPVYVLYWTAWVDEKGLVHFRSDRYGHDQALQRALDQAARAMRR